MNLYKTIYAKRCELKQNSKRQQQKLTFIESIVALVIAIAGVTFMALFLVDGIPYIVEYRHIKDE
jgi:hypothetical protein